MKHTLPHPHDNRPGYISILGVLSISIVMLLILTATYRSAVQSQNIQKRNQLYIDYTVREQAMLRATLSLAPNAAIKAMMSNSNSNPLKREASWQRVFEDALTLADAETSISSSEMNILGVPSGAISGNSADAPDWGTLRKVVSPVTGIRPSGFGITRGLVDQEPIIGTFDYPEFLSAVNTNLIYSDDNYPLVSTDKYYGTPSTQYKLIDYPRVHFGYGVQGQQFVAKRNWWAFSVHMGNEDDQSIGFQPRKRDYVLSLYEVPSQLALGSTTMTNIGQHSDGTDWANVIISGRAYAARAETKGTFSLSGLSSKEGITMSDSSSVGGIGAGGTAPTRESFESASGDFFPLSTSADSGLVSFIPINAGDDAYDNISNLQSSDQSSSADNRLSPTAWSWYSRPAVQCIMKLKIVDVSGLYDQTPTELSFSYMSGGLESTVVYSRSDGSWPTSNSGAGTSFPFHTENTPDGRLGLTVYIDRLNMLLQTLGADDSTVNHSLAVSADYLANPNVTRPGIPSLASDTALILRGTNDLTSFSSGFSITSAFRLYLAEDVNIEPYTAGGTDYPPLSLFAPEKRFGMRSSPMLIEFDGQINHLTKDSNAVDPLDLRSGTNESVIPANIQANLFSIDDPGKLPPINQMNWLVVIEEVH